MKMVASITAIFFCSFLAAHYPDDLTCEPMYKIHCSVADMSSLKNKAGSCRDADISNRSTFILKSFESKGKNPGYKMSTDWLNYVFIKVDTATLEDLDGGKISGQWNERTFVIPKIGGKDGFFDGDISAISTLSGTGHPHTLQLVIAHEMSAIITDIFYANCTSMKKEKK